MPPRYWLFVIATESRDALTAAACTTGSSSRVRTAARLASTSARAEGLAVRDAARGELVLDIGERREHRLLVSRDSFLVRRRRLLLRRLAQTAVENVLHEREAAGEAGVEAHTPAQAERRIELRLGHADLRVGLRHPAFVGGDVGTPDKQL